MKKLGRKQLIKDGQPCKQTDPGQASEVEMTDDEKIDLVAERVLEKYRKAFEELAK